jgi:hypothetical protein
MTRAPDTWRPPPRTLDPLRAFADTLPPERSQGDIDSPQASPDTSAQPRSRGDIDSLQALADTLPPPRSTGDIDPVRALVDTLPPRGSPGDGAHRSQGSLSGGDRPASLAGAVASRHPARSPTRDTARPSEVDSSLGDLDSPLGDVAAFDLGATVVVGWSGPESAQAAAPFHMAARAAASTRATSRPQRGPAAPPGSLAPPGPYPRDSGASLRELGLSVAEVERLTPLAARLSSHPLLSAARSTLTSQPPDAADTRSMARTRETVRPLVRRLRDTQRPGLRRASEPARLPTLRALDVRRFSSKPSVASTSVPIRRSAAQSAPPHPPAQSGTHTCGALQSCAHTCCANCGAVTPTQRASTLASIGWRMGLVPGQPLEGGQRWLCPKCHPRLTKTPANPAIGRKA